MTRFPPHRFPCASRLNVLRRFAAMPRRSKRAVGTRVFTNPARRRGPIRHGSSSQSKPVLPDPAPNPPSVVEVACRLAERLELAGCDYAFGGAISLGYWTEPRGTIDVDVTFYLPVDDLDRTIGVLRTVGADFSVADAVDSLREHGFCRLQFLGRRLDVFLPIASIYEAARPRRRRVDMGAGTALVWDAETFASSR